MIKAEAETKAKKKSIRKKNIAKGSTCTLLTRAIKPRSLTHTVEIFEKGCKVFEKDMHSSTPPFPLFPYHPRLILSSLRKLRHLPRHYQLRLRHHPRPRQPPHKQKLPLQPKGVLFPSHSHLSPLNNNHSPLAHAPPFPRTARPPPPPPRSTSAALRLARHAQTFRDLCQILSAWRASKDRAAGADWELVGDGVGCFQVVFQAEDEEGVGGEIHEG